MTGSLNSLSGIEQEVSDPLLERVTEGAAGRSCERGTGASSLIKSAFDSTNLANVNKALSSYNNTSGRDLSMAEQSSTENIFMQDVHMRNDQEFLKCLDHGIKQPGNKKQQPLTRAKAKNLAGGQQQCSLSQ